MAAVCGTDLVSGAGEMARRFAQVKVAQLDDLEDRAYADPHVVRGGGLSWTGLRGLQRRSEAAGPPLTPYRARPTRYFRIR
jgi:hypothetical protein